LESTSFFWVEFLSNIKATYVLRVSLQMVNWLADDDDDDEDEDGKSFVKIS
jgi:hypothetical protein